MRRRVICMLVAAICGSGLAALPAHADDCTQCLALAVKPPTPLITVIRPGKTSLEVGWVQLSTNSAMIEQYDMTWSDSDGPVGSKTVPATTTNPPTTIDGLTTGTAYTISVTSDTGEVRSDPTTFVEKVGVVPATPTIAGSTPEVFSSRLQVSDDNYWTLPDEVTYDTRATTAGGAHVSDYGDALPEVINVQEPAVYTVEVRVHNAVGASAWSAPAKVRIITVPGPIRDLRATTFGSPVTLYWSAPRHDNGAPVTGYRVEVLTDKGHFDRVWHPRTTSLVLDSLPTGRAFQWRVDAENVASKSPPPGSIYGSIVDGSGFSTDRIGATALDAHGRGWWRAGDGTWSQLGTRRLTRAPAAVSVRGRWVFVGSTEDGSVLVRRLHTRWHRLAGSACGEATASLQRGRLWVACRSAGHFDQQSAEVPASGLPTALIDFYNRYDPTPPIAGRPDAVRETGDHVDYLYAERTSSGVRDRIQLTNSVSTSGRPALSCDGPLAVGSLHSAYYDNAGYLTACRRSAKTVSWRVTGEDEALSKRGVARLPFAIRGAVAVCDPGGNVQLILSRPSGRLVRYDVATDMVETMSSPTRFVDVTAVVLPD